MFFWTDYARFVISLFAVVGPFTAVPAFLSLTNGMASTERSRLALTASATAALVLIAAALTGQLLLVALGASIGSLRVGGGFVLLMMAFSMLNPGDSPRQEKFSKKACGIVPLGLPLLAGPGAISAVIVESQSHACPTHTVVVIACVAVVCGVAWCVLRLAQPIGERIGQSGLDVVSRLFGLFLAAMAVQIIAQGLRALFPALG